MKRTFLSLIIFVFAFSACEKEATLHIPDLPEPLYELIDDGNCLCDPRIGMFEWNEESLFVYWHAGPACNSIPSFYNNEGDRIEMSRDEWEVIWNEMELIKMIWVCNQ